MSWTMIEEGHTALYDAVRGRAFGPVLRRDLAEDFERYLELLDIDPRHLSPREMDRVEGSWKADRLDEDGELNEETIEAWRARAGRANGG